MNLPALASDAFREDAELSALFRTHMADGSLILQRLDGTERFVHNPTRAKARMLPASTFKILRSLIAVDENISSRADDLIQWDGRIHRVKSWNKDQTFKSAFRVSCVWCYRGFTRSISDETYLLHLGSAGYGNGKTGKDRSQFWLNGDLAISAEEQIDFLEKFYNQQLDYSNEAFALVKDFMAVEKSAKGQLSYKAGWAIRRDGQHGWIVGFVEQSDAVWLFALNVEIADLHQAKLRKILLQEALKTKGIW